MQTEGIKKVFVTALTDVRDSDVEGVGTLRQEGSRRYKWCKFSGANAVQAGDALCYDVTDTNLDTVDLANSALGAGVAMAVHAAAKVTYGWIQLRGQAILRSALGGAVAVGSVVTNVGAAAGVMQLTAAATSLPAGIVVHVANKIVNLTYPD